MKEEIWNQYRDALTLALQQMHSGMIGSAIVTLRGCVEMLNVYQRTTGERVSPDQLKLFQDEQKEREREGDQGVPGEPRRNSAVDAEYPSVGILHV